MCNYWGQLDQNYSLYAVLAELVLHQIANLRLPYGVRRFESYTLCYSLSDKWSKLPPSQGGDESSILSQAIVLVAQLVKASECDSEERGFKSYLAPYSYIAQLARAVDSYPRGHQFNSNYSYLYGSIVQLVRTLPCHGRGRRFKSDHLRHFKNSVQQKYK